MDKEGKVTAFAFINPLDFTCALGYDNGLVEIIDQNKEEVITKLEHHHCPVTAIAVVDCKLSSSQGTAKFKSEGDSDTR